MSGGEIEVPREVRQFMPGNAVETLLGHKDGARKQYRYGNLHIREYDDKFLVHSDRVDPRKDAMGHLVHDAPEVLVGLACAVLGGLAARSLQGPRGPIPSSITTSVVAGYLGFFAARKIKDRLEGRHVKP